jgi:hypothetical protein
MEEARAGADVCERHLFSQMNDRIANFFHHTADGATGLVGTRALFVKLSADAADGSQRAFNVANDFGQGDVFGLAGEPVAAGDAAATLDKASRFQVGEDLFEEALGNILLFGDLRYADDAASMVQAEDEQRAESVLSFYGKFHGMRVASMVSVRVGDVVSGSYLIMEIAVDARSEASVRPEGRTEAMIIS